MSESFSQPPNIRFIQSSSKSALMYFSCSNIHSVCKIESQSVSYFFCQLVRWPCRHSELIVKWQSLQLPVFSYQPIKEVLITVSWIFTVLTLFRCPSEIIRRVTECEIPPFRPTVSQLIPRVEELRELMKLCWDEKPEARPEFHDIKKTLQRILNNSGMWVRTET